MVGVDGCWGIYTGKGFGSKIFEPKPFPL